MRCYKKSFVFLFLAITGLASCDEILEPALKNERITLLSPIDSVISTDTLQRLYWEHSEELVDYQVQVAFPRFDSLVQLVQDTVLSNNQLPIVLKKGRQYQWRVRAINNYAAGPFSTIWNFTIQ